MKRWLWLALLLFPCAMHAQVVGPGFINYVTSAPSGACSQGEQMRVVIGLGTVYTCQSGTWTQVGGAAGGVTTTGSPASGQVATFSGAATISGSTLFTFSGSTLTLGGSTSSGILALGGSTSGTATCTAPAIAGTSTNGVTCSNVFLLPNGTSSAPAYSFSAQAGTGFDFIPSGVNGGNGIGVTVNGGGHFVAFGASYIMFHPASPGIVFGSTDVNGTADTIMSRKGPGLMAFGNALTQGSTAGFIKTAQTAILTSDFTDSNASGLQAITGLSFALPIVATNWAFHCSLSYSEATPIASDQFGVASLTTAPTNLKAQAHVVTTEGAAAAQTTGNSGNIASTTPTSIVTFTPVGTGEKPVEIDGSIEVTGGGASTLQFYVTNGTAADVIVVKRDSYCSIW